MIKIQTLLKFYKIHLFFIGSFIGFISWSFEDIRLTIFNILIFYFYIKCNKRLDLLIVVISYLLVSSRGLLIGSITYYDQVIVGLLIWLSASLIILIPYALIWSRNERTRYFLLPILILILILPPFGFISWFNPIINAGLIFPGMGFFGLLLFIISFYIVIFLPKFKKLGFILILTFFILTNKLTPTIPNEIEAFNTEYLYSADNVDLTKEYFRQIDILDKSNSSNKNILVASENILGFYTSNSNMIWDQMVEDKILFAGANIKDKNNSHMYDNVIMSITAKEKKVLYKQRVPVLVSMWKPWDDVGAKAYIFDNPTVKTNDKNIAFFICYEQLLDFTYLHSAANNPDLFIGVSNLWWSKNTTIETIQHNRLKLYSILFDTPLVYSINR